MKTRPEQKRQRGQRKERPVDVIRRMNPGKWIPTGAELARKLKGLQRSA